MALSPDGELLAAVDEEKRVKLWDIASGQQRFTLTGHTERVTSLAFSPNRKRLATASLSCADCGGFDPKTESPQQNFAGFW
jgi:WD40 repeat protein